MAELFSYKGQQGVINPQSPFVQATPVNSPFSNLSELVLTAQKAQLNLKTLESADLTAQQKAANIDYDSALTNAYLDNDMKLSVQYNDYTTAMLEAGNDITKQQEITSKFNTEQEALYTSLAPEVQAKVITSYQAMKTNATNILNKNVQEFQKNELLDKVQLSVPNTLIKPLAEQMDDYQLLQTEAVKRGLTKQQFGDFYSKQQEAYIINQIDTETIVNNRDYSAILTLDDIISNMTAVDSKNINVINSLKSRRDTIKNSIDTAMRSDITSSIDNLQQNQFDNSVAYALDNGAINQDQADNYYIDYGQKLVSSGVLNQQKATEILTTYNGAVASVNLDADLKKELDSQTQAKLVENLRSPNPDIAFLNNVSTHNASVYQKSFRPFYDNALATLEGIAANPNASQGDISSAINLLDMRINQANGVLTPDDIFQANALKAVVVSGQGALVPQLMTNLRNQGGVQQLPISNTNVKKLQDNVPADQFNSARGAYSALVQSGALSEDAAYEVVSTSFTFAYPDKSFGSSTYSYNIAAQQQDIDSGFGFTADPFAVKVKQTNIENVGISGQLMSTLKRNNLVEPASFMYTLVNTDFLTRTENGLGLPEAKKEDVLKVIKGENPTTTFNNGVLSFKSSTGMTNILMDTNRLAATIDEANMIHAKSQRVTPSQQAVKNVSEKIGQVFDLLTEEAKWVWSAASGNAQGMKDNQKQFQAYFDLLIGKQDAITKLNNGADPAAVERDFINATGKLLKQMGRDLTEPVFNLLSSDANAMGNLDPLRQQEAVGQIPQATPFKKVAEYLQPVIAQIESGTKHTQADGSLTKSPVGALGMYQIMPKTAKNPGYGVKPIPDLNKASLADHQRFYNEYMTAMLKVFNGDVDKAVAAYNGGVGTVKKSIAANGARWLDPLPKETKDYVKKVRKGLQP